MTSARSHQYIPRHTVEDYEKWEGKWELWAGIPVAMSPSPSHQHQVVCRRLMRCLEDAIDDAEGCDRCVVAYDTDWRIDLETVIRPDVYVVCEPVGGKFLTKAPTFIAEILSPSTAGKDRLAKRGLYAAEGVNTYFIIDHERRAVEALRRVGDAFETITTDTRVPVELHDGCRIELDLDRLWDERPTGSA